MPLLNQDDRFKCCGLHKLHDLTRIDVSGVGCYRNVEFSNLTRPVSFVGRKWWNNSAEVPLLPNTTRRRRSTVSWIKSSDLRGLVMVAAIEKVLASVGCTTRNGKGLVAFNAL